MKIYTKTGDHGETGFLGGRISKNSKLIHVIGNLDELNAHLGGCISLLSTSGEVDSKNTGNFSVSEIIDMLLDIQRQLFSCGAILINNQVSKLQITPDQIELLESQIDAADAELLPLQNFILPGGTPAAAQLHITRTVCRRAERSMVDWITTIDPEFEGNKDYQAQASIILKYLNRLSDLLFTYARLINQIYSTSEQIWRG